MKLLTSMVLGHGWGGLRAEVLLLRALLGAVLHDGLLAALHLVERVDHLQASRAEQLSAFEHGVSTYAWFTDLLRQGHHLPLDGSLLPRQSQLLRLDLHAGNPPILRHHSHSCYPGLPA